MEEAQKIGKAVDTKSSSVLHFRASLLDVSMLEALLQEFLSFFYMWLNDLDVVFLKFYYVLNG